MINVNVVASVDQIFDTIKGSGEQFFRVDDKSDYEKVTERSKYHHVKLTARKVIVLTIGKKHLKYSIVSTEYQNDEQWAAAVQKLFANKLVQRITEEEFLNDFNEFILGEV